MELVKKAAHQKQKLCLWTGPMSMKTTILLWSCPIPSPMNKLASLRAV